MPELPQIEPTDVGLSKPIVQSQPNPIGGQIASQMEKFQDQAIEMGKQVQHMNRYINFHMADAEYMTKSADIFDATRAIPDPDTQFATRQRVLGELRDQVAAKYPAAGPELGPQLALRSSEDVRRARLEATATSVSNTKDNLDALEEPTIVAATAAPTQAQADAISQKFEGALDQAVRTGFIGTGDRDKRLQKYQYNLQFAQVTKLGLEDPLKVLAMKPEDSGLRPQDLSLIQWRTGGVLQRKEDSAKRDFQSVINTNDQAVYDGNLTDPGKMNQLHEAGMLSPEALRYGTHAEPTNAAVATPILNYINSAPDMTPNEWEHYRATSVAGNKYMEPSDRQAANGAIDARVSDAKLKEGVLKKTYTAEIKRALKAKYPGAFGSNSNPRQMADYSRDEEIAVAQLDGAKSFDEMKRIRDEQMKNAAPVRHTPVVTDSDKAKKLMDALGIK